MTICHDAIAYEADVLRITIAWLLEQACHDSR